MAIHSKVKRSAFFYAQRPGDYTIIDKYNTRDGSLVSIFHDDASNIEGDSLCVDANGNLYFSISSTGYCFDKDGNQVWSQAWSVTPTAMSVTPDGKYLLYIGSSKLYLVNAETGAEIRSFSQVTDNTYFDGIILSDYTILFARRDVGSTEQRGAVLDLEGNVLHYLDSFDAYYGSVGHAIAYSPFNNTYVASGTNGKAGYTFYNVKTGEKLAGTGIGADNYTWPFLDMEGNLYIGDTATPPNLKKVKFNSSTVLWSTPLSGGAVKGGFVDEAADIVYVGINSTSGNAFYALDKETGKVLWFGPASSGQYPSYPVPEIIPTEPPSPPVLNISDAKLGTNVPVAGIAGINDDYIQAQTVAQVPMLFRAKDTDLIKGDTSSLFDCSRHSEILVRAAISVSGSTVKIRPVYFDLNGTKSIGQEITLSEISGVTEDGKYLCELVSLPAKGANAIEILISDTPTLTAPSNVSAATSASGTLNGTFYYKVSAYVNGGFTDLSAEVSGTVDGGTNSGTITVSWDAVTGATKYRVYRGTSADGETEGYDVTTNSLADDGSLSWIPGVDIPSENKASTCTIDLQISGA